MNIVLCSSDYLPNIGGVATHVHELARALQALGVPVCVVTFRGGNWLHSPWFPRWVDRGGVRTLELPLAGGPAGRGRFWRLRRYARGLLARCGLDGVPAVLHVHDCDYGNYLAEHITGVAAKVFTNHTSGFLQDMEEADVPGHWVRRLKVYDRVLAPSRELAEGAVRVGTPRERVSYIPNGVDPERFKPDAELRRRVRVELGVPDGEVVVLCARRFVPKNGVIDFAHGLRSLAALADRTTVLFAGNAYGAVDTYEKETIGAVKRSPLGNKARFLGAVPNAEMHRLYAAADIGVLPSLKEATSITGLESMACGLPLVGTRVGGIPDLIDHDVTGLLAEPGDPRSFGEAVGRLVADPPLREKCGRNARDRVLASFTWGRVAARTLDAYRQAFEAGGRAAAEAGGLGPQPHRDLVVAS
jgi:glycosyltransferase involved in cell wall biosynthesis